MKYSLLFSLLLVAISASAKKNDSLDIKIGQMIMMGINERISLPATDPLIQDLKAGKLGGVVIFEKNLAKSHTRDSLILLVQNLQQSSLVPLFVSIDEEGGKVHRLKEKYGFFSTPSAAYLGEVNKFDSTRYHSRRIAALLRELGINFNYAPALDMAVNPENTVIVKNGRSFGADPFLVATHAQVVINAHHEYGVKTILKHFPGHGSSAGDSHLGVVHVSGTWQLNELTPYDELIRHGSIDAIMTAHIINKRWDPDLLPATLSAKTVNGLLRGLLGYKGVVFSDDMQMDAISDNYGLEKAIVLAVNAGVDVLMFANTAPKKEKLVTATQVHDIIKKLVRKKKISRERINEAYERIMALKNKQF
ncbi:MAG: glycoside hydrolase family 3 protein [Flavipsychrobacter sp.]|nr:glycoside hydrolase family 3 protein [Flavipsychrobacter sp.]